MDGWDGWNHRVGWDEIIRRKEMEWENIQTMWNSFSFLWIITHVWSVWSCKYKIVFASQQSISIKFSWLLRQTVPDNDCLLSLWKYYMDVLDVEAYHTNQLLIVITNMKEKNMDLRCRHRIPSETYVTKWKWALDIFVDFLFCSVRQIIIAWLDWVYHKLQS